MEELVLGTKEYLPVVVSDRLANLTTLDGLTIQFEVKADDDAATTVINWTSATNDGMTVLPLIDTTGVGFTPGVYKLYIKITVAPEVPILGPFDFLVV